MSERTVLFITKAAEAASSRYRATSYFPALRAAGWRPEHIAADDGDTGALGLLAAAHRAEVVVLCRKPFSAVFRRALRSAARRLVFDLDDAIFTGADGRDSPGRRRKFAGIARLADEVWAGNDHLARYARQYNDRVRVLPTSVDPQRYEVTRPKPADTLDLVWIGSSSTRKYLEAILPALEAAADRVPRPRLRLRLKIIADFSLSSDRLTTLAVPWSADDEAGSLTSSHIGLAPMADDAWTRGKCGLKVLQYMAARLPVVAASAGVHKQIIVPGETGLLVDNDQSWADAIAQLAEDAALRQRMGDAGWQRLQARYARPAVAAQMIAALEALRGGVVHLR